MTMFTDHSGLDEMVQVSQLNAFRATATRYGIVQSFWASAARAADSPMAEVLEISFTNNTLVNSIQLDLAKFPHVLQLQVFDEDSGDWIPLVEADGNQATRYVHDCVPATLPPASSVRGHQHPQHSFVGHWQTEKIELAPIRMTRLRLVLTRQPVAVVPYNVFGKAVDYSLAVRNLVVGFVVSSLDDVPRTLPSGDTDQSYSQTFATSNDLVSSAVEYSLRVLDPARAVRDNAPDAVWRCEPQPSPDCVVNFFLDVRQANGDPQVIDRIWIDPINNGAHITAYFATDETGGAFASPDLPLPLDAVDATSDTKVDRTGLRLAPVGHQEGYDFSTSDDYPLTALYPIDIIVSAVVAGTPTTFAEGTDYTLVDDGSGAITVHRESGGTIPTDGTTTTITYLSQNSIILDNLRFNYDPQSPWWLGLVVRPQFDPSALTAPAVLFDCGFWQLALDATRILFTSTLGDTVAVDFTYQQDLPITLVLGYDGQQYTLWADASTNGDASSFATATPHVPHVTGFAIGSDLGRTVFGNSIITSLVMKQEAPPADGFAYEADPRAYTLVSEYARDEPTTSRTNAVLRFDPLTTLQSSAFPWALFGGTPSRYENLVWTPIARDYTAQRGWMELPATRARYWKLEFTRLPPVYSDVFVPISQRIRHFPAAEINAYRARLAAASPPPSVADEAHAQVAAHTNYDDTPIVVSTGGTDLGYTNTEVYVADELSAADRLRSQRGADWAYQQFIAGQSAPRFTATQRHVYETQLVTRTSKVAYQIGLSNLRVARSSFSAQYDNPQYVEMLYDTSELDDSTNWGYDPDLSALTSGNSSRATILSKVYRSNRNVRAVQFAAQQSPPRQMIEDSEFLDPTASTWSAIGDATLGEPIESVAFDQLLPVRRTLGSGTWGDIAPRYGGTWGGIMAAGATWGDLARKSDTPTTLAAGNGIVSESVPIPAGGYVYAAARLIADEDLFAPVYLQIVDSVTGTVLAENSVTVRRGQVTEWYTTYELDTALAEGRTTWGDVAGQTHLPSYLDLFTRADATGLGRMNSGQDWATGKHWNGSAGTPLDIVSDTAKVVTANSRSIVDVGTPWGKLTVGLGHIVTGTAQEMVYFGGLLVMNTGAVLNPQTGQVYTTLTLADGDTLTMESMPTSQVPVGESSGADASIKSWSIVISRNGTFVTTISFSRPLDHLRGLAGLAGQTFASFTWVPSTIALPLEHMIYELPVPRDGSLNGTGDTWTQDSDGRQWFVDGSFTEIDTGSQYQLLQAPAAASFEFSTDVGEMYGSLSTKIDTSGTSTSLSTFYVLKLDEGAGYGLYLRADGHLIQFTAALGYVDLGVILTSFSSSTTIHFAQTSKLSSAFMTTWSLSGSFPQTLIASNGPTVTGVVQGTDLWLGTIRGLMATDLTTHYGMSWGPNLGAVSSGSGGSRTWDEVSGGGTRTWGDLARSAQVLANPVEARVVQKVPSSDAWYMDSLPVFIDPLVWEMSNDGGKSWTPASTIRNNPRGAVMFGAGDGTNRLRYRVTSYGKDTWLSHLVIRPWYAGHMRDVPVRPPVPHGPNLQPLDSYLPVEEDPNFKVWSLPIPREWWYAFRSLLPGISPSRNAQPIITERSVLR